MRSIWRRHLLVDLLVRTVASHSHQRRAWGGWTTLALDLTNGGSARGEGGRIRSAQTPQPDERLARGSPHQRLDHAVW